MEIGRSLLVRSSRAPASLRTRTTSLTVCPVALKTRFTVRIDTLSCQPGQASRRRSSQAPAASSSAVQLQIASGPAASRYPEANEVMA
jgi:hypothetical protein